MTSTLYTRYPARVTGNDGLSVNRSAVIVFTDGRALVATLTHGRTGTPQVIAELADVTVMKNPDRTVLLASADGTEWTVERGDGCGCKSPLTRWLSDQQGTPKRSGT